jgi:Pyruvate/2-oxoacid:ferredoxin oxidoreductase delta subunit
MAKTADRPFRASAEQQALSPPVSGNALNGLGEAEARPPTPIYWHSPGRIAHGPLQQYMLARTQRDVPVVAGIAEGLGGRGPKERAPKGKRGRRREAADWTRRLKDVALRHEADLVGVAAMRPDWVFEGYAADFPWMIVLGLAMDHAELATAPEPPSVIEVMRQYNRGTRAARALADWILSQGYEALPHGGPQAGPALMIPAALQAGFGELGKHGSIISRDYGSSFRLASVLTDMPLAADQAAAFGADGFCENCRACARACPPAAIGHEKQLVRGSTKWYVDFDACISYFNESYGCGICIAVCPWSRPGIAPNLIAKLSRRRQA